MRHYDPTLSVEESILVQPGGGNGINGPVVTQKSTEAIAGDIKTVPDLTVLLVRVMLKVQYSKLIRALPW